MENKARVSSFVDWVNRLDEAKKGKLPEFLADKFKDKKDKVEEKK